MRQTLSRLCNALRRSGDAGAADIPIIVVADAADLDGGKAAGVTDWLIRPFSSATPEPASRLGCFARPAVGESGRCPRTKSSGWRRCIALASSIRPREQRFDRLTRLAAAIMGVPVALISFVDRDRQWFKSVHGLEIAETHREVSFCAHAVALREMLVVPDALQDARFADNPLVTGEPRIRFYAGFPLFIAGKPHRHPLRMRYPAAARRG